MDPNFLQTLWFVLICVLWVGYFVLEGFDFGVGMLLRALGRDETDKRMIIHSIGPVWDGNEVWLITAGGATFAAFPGWYASLFSGFYLALLLILLALIVRGVSFEFWGKSDSPRWRATWEWATVIGSGATALLWGVAWANIVHGVPMNAKHEVTTNIFGLLHPYALLGGLTTLVLFLAHGAIFLSLRTRGELMQRARAVARPASALAALLVLAFLVWTTIDQASPGGVKISALVLAVFAIVLAAAVPFVLATRRDGRAFALSAGAIALLFASLFVCLFPDALPATNGRLFSLTLAGASASHYSQTVMTVVAIVFLPIVLLYQGWTYWVFRHRLGREDFEGGGTPTPVAVLGRKLGGTQG
ncbi:MAG TPA: cytochrome d ubiquinol oxidase subunit II [Solirubrobacteraceae bacterium]|jgi:cytochrome d ubiquinol oxidase subunit II|nr:cytochrome d ubiquinol oxidase subunit II [Solirubrobacteraceae bacterium]